MITRRAFGVECLLGGIAIVWVASLSREGAGALPPTAPAEQLMAAAQSEYDEWQRGYPRMEVVLESIQQDRLVLVEHRGGGYEGITITATVLLANLDPTYLRISPIELREYDDRPCVVLAALPEAPEFAVHEEFWSCTSSRETDDTERFVMMPFDTAAQAEEATEALLFLAQYGGPQMPVVNPAPVDS